METFKPLSQYNAFFKLALERTLCGIDQLVGLHIENKFNQAHWAETIQVEDAELLKLICWYDKTGKPTSIDTIRKAKARLKKKGFIDFEPGKGNRPTEYRLIRLYPTDTPADTPTNTPADLGVVSYTRMREDVKDFKDFKDREDDGRVREGDVAEATKPQVSNTSVLPLKSPISETDANEIHDVWFKAFDEPLLGDNALKLEQYAKEDYAKTQAAIAKTATAKAKKAKGGNPLTNPFAYFQTVYNDESSEQTQPPLKNENTRRAQEKKDEETFEKLLALTGRRRD